MKRCCFFLLAFWLAIAGQAAVSQAYEVRSGDCLYVIARQHGVSVSQIAQANKLKNPNLIYPGQTLLIPSGNTVAVSGNSDSFSLIGRTIGVAPVYENPTTVTAAGTGKKHKAKVPPKRNYSSVTAGYYSKDNGSGWYAKTTQEYYPWVVKTDDGDNVKVGFQVGLGTGDFAHENGNHYSNYEVSFMPSVRFNNGPDHETRISAGVAVRGNDDDDQVGLGFSFNHSNTTNRNAKRRGFPERNVGGSAFLGGNQTEAGFYVKQTLYDFPVDDTGDRVVAVGVQAGVGIKNDVPHVRAGAFAEYRLANESVLEASVGVKVDEGGVQFGPEVRYNIGAHYYARQKLAITRATDEEVQAALNGQPTVESSGNSDRRSRFGNRRSYQPSDQNVDFSSYFDDLRPKRPENEQTVASVSTAPVSNSSPVPGYTYDPATGYCYQPSQCNCGS